MSKPQELRTAFLTQGWQTPGPQARNTIRETVRVLEQLLREEGNGMRNARARAFAEALKEWDSYKAVLKRQLDRGQISKEEHDRRLAAKARELDL